MFLSKDVWAQQSLDLRSFSGQILSKSRFSSEPQYLCKDEKSYWFFFRDGRERARILRLEKELGELQSCYIDFNPDRDKLRSGRISEGILSLDILRNTRSQYQYIRHMFDTSCLYMRTDTLFQFRKTYPLQALHVNQDFNEHQELIWFIPDEKGFTEYRRLFVCRIGASVKTDSLRLMNESGHLSEVLHSELLEKKIRIYLKQYDLRPSEKRAFAVNYTYGWLEVVMEDTSRRIMVIQRENFYLSNPCFQSMPGDSIFLAGLYGTDAKTKAVGYYQYSGPIYASAEDTVRIHPQFQRFNDSFWLEHRYNKKHRTLIKPKKLHHYYIQNFSTHPAEGYNTFLMQQLYTTDGGSVAGSQLYYHFKDEVIFRTNAAGNLLWFRRIPANQVIYEPFLRFAGSTVFEEDEEVLLFQNEHRRNAGKSQARRSMSRATQGELVLRVIAPDGNDKSQVIRPAFTSGKTALPASMIKIRQGHYLVFFESTHELIPVYIYR